MKFEWDAKKDAVNLEKHKVDFSTAARAFDDPGKIYTADRKHHQKEARFLCIGAVDGKVLTVRFVMRGGVIRIIGAGAWRFWRKIYEEKNKH
jgi:uncharacterized DUF497 family protein